jgi:hypothetical protein
LVARRQRKILHAHGKVVHLDRRHHELLDVQILSSVQSPAEDHDHDARHQVEDDDEDGELLTGVLGASKGDRAGLARRK